MYITPHKMITGKPSQKCTCRISVESEALSDAMTNLEAMEKLTNFRRISERSVVQKVSRAQSMGFKKFEHIGILLGWGKHSDFVRFRLKRRFGAIITQIVAVSAGTIPGIDISWVQPYMKGPDNTGEIPYPLFEHFFGQLAMANVSAKEARKITHQLQ